MWKANLFLFISELYSKLWVYHSVTINLLKNIQIVSGLRLLWVKLALTFVHKVLCKHKFWFLWDKYPRVQWLVLMLITGLIL